MDLKDLLTKNIEKFGKLFQFSLLSNDVHLLDLSDKNPDLTDSDVATNEALGVFITNSIKNAGKKYAKGGYSEKRLIYKRSNHFDNTEGESRCIHLGVDIWCEAGTTIFAPLDGKIHSFQNNNNFGDYGPTIIIEHQLNNTKFYSLYGHISLNSIVNLEPNSKVVKGQAFAEIGDPLVNGNWPPHLHFQLIADIGNKKGDYPGVTTEREALFYLKNCPNPNIILK